MQGGMGLIPGWELGSYMPFSSVKKKKEKNLKAFSNCSYQPGGLELSLQSETKRKVKSDCPCITIGLFEAMNAVVSLKPYDVDELASLWV